MTNNHDTLQMQVSRETNASVLNATQTGAQSLVEHFVARGVKHMYGVPGGDCSLDIIDAAEKFGIRFVLTRTENAAAMMACSEAELTGSLGVVLTTRGPGVANAANGVAYASLDRVPMVFISDGYDSNQDCVSHQRFDQKAMLSPVIKGALRLDDVTSLPAVGGLLDLAMSDQPGPVYIEVTGHCMRNTITKGSLPIRVASRAFDPPTAQVLQLALDCVAGAQRPILVIGLQCRGKQVSQALRSFAHKLQCPVFSTYKAKGVMPEADMQLSGYFINGAAEEETFLSADLIIMFGADPVEFPPSAFKYSSTPVLEFTNQQFNRNVYRSVLSVAGDLAQAALQMCAGVRSSSWGADELKSIKAHMLARAAANVGGPITPQLLVETTCHLMPTDARCTVDAGVHMLSVIAHFQARDPFDLIISRGLATIGIALPAAIGMAMADPKRHVVTFIGDGGLMMCTAELATAVELGCNITVVVFNDSAITMIGLKQKNRQFGRVGMDYGHTDFAKVGQGFGCQSFRATTPADLKSALVSAFACEGPTLVDAVLDPTAYQSQLKSLRG